MEESMIDKDKLESEEILEIRQGRCYVRIPRKKNDIELIKKILEVFEEVEDPEPIESEPAKKFTECLPSEKLSAPKPAKKIKRVQVKYPDGLRNFCIKNIDQYMKNGSER